MLGQHSHPGKNGRTSCLAPLHAVGRGEQDEKTTELASDVRCVGASVKSLMDKQRLSCHSQKIQIQMARFTSQDVSWEETVVPGKYILKPSVAYFHR